MSASILDATITVPSWMAWLFVFVAFGFVGYCWWAALTDWWDEP